MSFDPSRQQPPAAPQPGAPTPPPAGGPSPFPPTGGQPGVPSFIPPTVAAAAANPKPRSRVSAGTIAFVAAIVIAAAGLGFAGGRLTAPASTGRGGFAGGNFPGGSFTPGGSGTGNRGGFGGLGAASISIDGQVTAVANGSITIQTANGQSVTLQVPSTVTYHAQASAAPSDVTVGASVQVSVNRGNFRPEASGQPGAPGQPGQGGLNLTATDITVLSK